MANVEDSKTETNNGTTDAESKEDSVKKTEPIELTNELQNKIVRQVEYYFGDFNLPKDKFLQEQIALDEGWLPLTVLLTFKRLVAICSDADTIAQALINSNNDLIVVSDDRKKIRRNPKNPVPEYNEERRKELMTRTAYVKGFPSDESLENLMKFFEPLGAFDSVYMRSYKDKESKKNVFKGSVFVVFKSLDICKEFMAKEDIKFNDTVLIRKWQGDYLDEKKKERDERNEKRGKNKESKQEQKKHDFPKGVILHMSGLNDNATIASIKKQVTEINEKEPAYVTFEKGEKEGYIRFSDENGAADFVKKLTDAKFKLDDVEVSVRVLEGEEEEKFLTELSATLAKIKNQHRFAGRGKNRKRKGGGDGGPRVKHVKK